MTGMKPITRRALLLTVAGFVADAGLQHAAAQSDVNKNNQRRLSVSDPDSSDDPTPDGPSWHNTTQIVTEDLRASGRFVLIEPRSPIIEKVDAVPQFDKWRGIPTGWLVTGHVTPAANQRIKVEFRLWNVTKGEHVLGQQYFLSPEDWRRVSHVITEAILKRLSDE
jgi:TolB protein